MLSGKFHVARLKLTAIYIVILAAILFISSGVIYSAFANQLAQRFRRFEIGPNVIISENFIPPRQQDVLDDLVFSLYMVNGILLIVAGTASYWLAGLTLEPIQRAYDRQRRFLGDASHELRTPLTVLKIGHENRLAEALVPDEERQQLVSDLEEIDRMSAMVNDLLALSRMDEEDGPTKVPAALDLDAVISKLHERFLPLAQDKQVDLGSGHIVAGLRVKADGHLLEQALGNIIKNAIVHNKPDGRVTLSVEKADGFALVKVADTGIGIPPEEQAKVFDRFYRADASRSRATGGSGLGLAIVKSAMDRLGGSVELESTVGQGTTVTLKVPLA